MSQAGIVDIEGANPQIPTAFVTDSGTAVPIANTLEILGTVVSAHSIPLQTTGSGNTVTVEVQYASAAASSSGTNAGVASFNSADFTVDANGFVSSTGGGGGSITIDGDTGSAAGSTITFNATPTCGSSVSFSASGSTVALNVTDVNLNTIIGLGSGDGTISGTENVSLGDGSLILLGIGSTNISIGSQNLTAATDGSGNIAIGSFVLASVQTDTTGHIGIGQGALFYYNDVNPANGSNIVMGTDSLSSLVTGGGNLVLGNSSVASAVSGARHTILGSDAGGSLAGSESDNIYIGYGSGGIGSESNTLRIGQSTGTGPGALNQAFISGINGNTVSNQLFVTIDSATDQLGTVSGGSGSITIDGDVGSVSGSTISLLALTQTSGQNAGSSVSFTAGSATEMDFNLSDANANTFIGSNSGATLTAQPSISANTAVGSNSLQSLSTSSNGNVAVGYGAGYGITTGSVCVAIGQQALANSFTPSLTGNYNIAIGPLAGNNYTSSEESNICINSPGVVGDSHVLRIGNGTGSSTNTGQLAEAFISGINGNTVANQKLVTIDSSTDQLGAASLSLQIQTFTTSGTYTPTSGMVYCIIECVGGGGGGGGCGSSSGPTNGAAGAGGGGGGYTRSFYSAATIGASQSVTVGAGGSGGSNSGGTGGTGGTSSVGSLLSASGGTGGEGATAAIFVLTTGGNGGGGVSGAFNSNGGCGTLGIYNGTSSTNASVGGVGGSSVLGGGGLGNNGTGGGPGGGGGDYGGGGGGAVSGNSSPGETGGTGAAGIVVITEYIIS